MEKTLTVSRLVEIINDTLSQTFPSLLVEGEITGYKLWNNRLAFFDLKDEAALVNCLLPVGLQMQPLEDGMQVRCRLEPRLTRKGRFSCHVRSVELVGEGALLRAFELLKGKFAAEGLFDPVRKRPLPRFPERLGLVTSLESAAYRDFLKILDSRWGGIEVLAVHSQVQGEAATEQLVAAINYFNQAAQPPDVLIITRGGGSLEDLAAFNAEPVVRAVAASRIPTVVGVGHEVDVSLADLVADLRAATPSDAARLVVPERVEVSRQVSALADSLGQLLLRQVDRSRQLIARAAGSFERLVQAPRAQLDSLRSRLAGLTQTHVNSRQRLLSLQRVLAGYDPAAVLARGYALVRKGSRIISSVKNIKKGDLVVIQLAQGRIDAETKRTQD